MSVFWTKTEFSNVVKSKRGSQGAVTSAKDSQRCLVGVSQGNPLKGFCLFISGSQIT